MAERPTGPHDVGGLPDALAPDRFEAVVVDSSKKLLVQKGLMTLDELRRSTEALPGYATMDYYTKWAAASAAIAIERGTFSRQEWEAALLGGPDPAQLDTAVRFSEGGVVRVRPEDSAIRWRKPHLRTPGYIFGLLGRVERPCVGLFGDPEHKAFREDAPKQPLYRVRFLQSHVWELYDGSPADSLDVEVYQPWLEPATEAQLQAQADRSAVLRAQLRAPPPQQPGATGGGEGAGLQQQQQHHHHHHHEHEHEHEHDHVHEARSQVEQAAVDAEQAQAQQDEGGSSSSAPRVVAALQALLTAKGVITPAELRREVELMDARGMKQEGPRLVARAWQDPAFKARLLQDTAAAAAELGISTSNFPAKPAPPAGAAEPQGAAAVAAGASQQPQARSGTVLTAVENTPEQHNLVVCTLCSCYPISVLGMSPHWYRSRAYRARAVRDPRGLLAEAFGTHLPASTAIRVHDSTADLRYIVIPARPEGTDGWTEQQLRRLVTRDSMIGVAPALTPAQLAAAGTAEEQGG